MTPEDPAHLQHLCLCARGHILARQVKVALGELPVAAACQLVLVSPVHLHATAGKHVHHDEPLGREPFEQDMRPPGE